MWPIQETRQVVTIVLPVLLSAHRVLGQGDPTTHTSTPNNVTKTAPSISTVEPTCESRTVNYITHTLPQQCLTSSPSASPTPESITVTATPSATTAESTPQASDDSSTLAQPELDPDGNDLSTGAFMSFEEWKAMMLEKSGQEALEARPRKIKEGRGEAYPGEDFDSLGDEGEVSLDFDAYSDRISEITSSTKPSQKEKEGEAGEVEKVTYDEGLAHGYRSKDAGKTCKERFSYASFDAGATVLKASPGAKNTKAILVENKDSYMLLECAMENKFFIVELSDDILVDTVVLANFEFFSSMIRQFRVSVSDRYPAKQDKWKVLGTFEARNSRDIQPFLVENPQIWARYLQIEFLSHFGNEYYCPVSLLRVHGTRMLDSWKEADPADLEIDDDGSKTISEGVEEPVETAEAHAEEEVEVVEPPQFENHTIMLEQSDWVPYWEKSYFYTYLLDATCAVTDIPEPTSQNTEEYDQNTAPTKPQSPTTTTQADSVGSGAYLSETTTEQPASQTSDLSKSAATPSSGEASADSTTSNSTESASVVTSSPEAKSTTMPPSSSPTTITPPSQGKPSIVNSAPRNKTASSASLKPPSSKSVVSRSPSGSPATSRNKTTTTTSSAASTPTVQDSFFKALTKRLQTLESNTTLSLQYIESQSKFLQEALARLEKRQVAKVDLFLDTLNKTVLGELREVRTQYDQVWQSTVIALETQREQSEREIVALGARLGVLADEVVFQKRMAIVQSVLLLGCLVLVIFSRIGAAAGAGGFVESYYPSQFLLGSSSRLASPVFPSTPKAGPPTTKDHHGHHGHHGHHHHDSTAALLSSIEDPGSAHAHEGTPAIHRNSSSSNNNRHRHESPRPIPGPALNLSLGQTPESSRSSHNRRPGAPRNGDGETSDSSSEPGRRRRPSPSRASAEPPDLVDFMRPQTPSSIGEFGYDSEPAMTPAAGGDYFSTPAASVNGGGGSGGEESSSSASTATYPKMLARKAANRQLTPSSESDGGVEYVASRPGRPSLTHTTTSARKPLPALPEDPD
ncbi:hypothetical protein F5B20DRAFT_533126 [Whalleya microplaca]|nr:hypothetical protein F5B20DRAFT_533126 [Whalleya microplaca]